MSALSAAPIASCSPEAGQRSRSPLQHLPKGLLLHPSPAVTPSSISPPCPASSSAFPLNSPFARPFTLTCPGESQPPASACCCCGGGVVFWLAGSRWFVKENDGRPSATTSSVRGVEIARYRLQPQKSCVGERRGGRQRHKEEREEERGGGSGQGEGEATLRVSRSIHRYL